jgi:hypothetical protein
MAWWQEVGLPNRKAMEVATFTWVLKQRDYIYYTDELKDHLAQHFRLTPEQINATTDNGKAICPNHVDWQSANWTTLEYHKQVGAKRNKCYQLTDAGLRRAKRALEGKPY